MVVAVTTGILAVLAILVVSLAAVGWWWYCVWKSTRDVDQDRRRGY